MPPCAKGSDRHSDASPGEAGRTAELRSYHFGRGQTIAGHRPVPCAIAAQVCDPGFRCGTKASGQRARVAPAQVRSEEHTSELQSHLNLVCRLLLEKKKKKKESKEDITENTLIS